jgi:hypothetical protein
MVKTFYKNINWIFFTNSFKTHRKKCLNVLSWISHRRQVHQVAMKDLLNPVRKMCKSFHNQVPQKTQRILTAGTRVSFL